MKAHTTLVVVEYQFENKDLYLKKGLCTHIICFIF